MIIDAEDHDLLAGLIDLWGEAKATSFLKQIAQDQKATFSRQSHTFMTQLVASGEHDVIVDGYVHNAVALKGKGAPIDYVMTNPTIIRPPTTIALTARAPHPYAAALLLDYHLSKEASEIMVKKSGPLGAAQRCAVGRGTAGRPSLDRVCSNGGESTASWSRCSTSLQDSDDAGAQKLAVHLTNSRRIDIDSLVCLLLGWQEKTNSIYQRQGASI